MPGTTEPPVDGGSGTGGTGSTDGGTGGSGIPAIAPGHPSPTFGIALWNADTTQARMIPLSVIVPNVTARITSTEGYGEASFSVWGNLADDILTGLVPRCRVEYWAIYKDSTGTIWNERLYSGVIRRTYPKKEGDGRQSIAVQLYGVWALAANCPCKKRYAPEGFDKSNRFGDLAAKFVNSRYPLLSVDVQPVGDTSDALDAYDVRFGDAAQTLAQNTSNIVMGGGRLSSDPYAPDCIYFRPIESTATPAHIINFGNTEKNQIGSSGDEQDDTKRCTELTIKGGPLANKGNILGDAVEGNTSFEFPIIPGADGSGNLVQNPGFENGDKTNPTSWALHGGAIRDQQDDGIAPFSGNRYLRLNHVSDDAFQLLIPEEAIVPGRGYVLDCRSHLGSASYPASGELRYQWRNSSGAYFGSVFSFAINPADTIYGLYGGVVVPPTGAVALSIVPTCTVSASTLNALIIDEVRFFDATAVRQKGWDDTSDQPEAYFNTIRWDDDVSPWHGGRCVYVDVVAADDDAQNARIQPTNLARFTVDGGAHLVCGALVKLAPGSGSVIVRPELYEWHNGGTYQGKTETGQITLSSTSWTLITTDRQYQRDAEEGSFAVQFRGIGQVYVDACFVMRYGATLPDPAYPEFFIEGENYEATFFARDLFGPGDAPYQAYLEIGNEPQTEEHPELITATDATAYALDFFNRYATVLDRPTVETFGVVSTGRGTTASMMPGEMVRGIGPTAFNVLPDPKPLIEKEILWDDKTGLTIRLYCNEVKRDPARSLYAIALRAARQVGTQTPRRSGSVGRGTTSSDMITGVDDTSGG